MSDPVTCAVTGAPHNWQSVAGEIERCSSWYWSGGWLVGGQVDKIYVYKTWNV